MKKIIIFSVLLGLLGFSISFAQMTKEEKRELRKQTRKLLKNAKDSHDNGKLDEALIFLDSLLLLDTKNADGYHLKGFIEIQKGDTTLAIETLGTGVTASPLSTRIKILFARIKIAQGDFDGAAELLDAILKIKPNEPETLYLRGLTFLNQNDSTKALEYLQNGLENALEKDH